MGGRDLPRPLDGARSKSRRTKARRILLDGRGTHFDPDVVDAFVALGSDVQRIAADFRDSDQALAEKAAALERLRGQASPPGAKPGLAG